MKKALTLLSCLCFSTIALADSIPAETQQGSQAYSHDMCVSHYTDECINVICVEGNTAIDCPDHCQKVAEEKCQAQQE